jgi:hypothetical protein
VRIFSLFSFFLSHSFIFADVQVGEIQTWSDLTRLYGSPGERVPATSEHRQVEAILGYNFKHGELVKEAFSHPSKIDQVSFERSEWLGDAVRRFFSLPTLSRDGIGSDTDRLLFLFFLSLYRHSTIMCFAGRGRGGVER